MDSNPSSPSAGHMPAHEQLERQSRSLPHTQPQTPTSTTPTATPVKPSRDHPLSNTNSLSEANGTSRARSISNASSLLEAPSNTPQSTNGAASDTNRDLRRVSVNLQSIQELHNEMVDNDAYPPPNPPKTTPFVTPAPSVAGTTKNWLPRVDQRLEHVSSLPYVSPTGSVYSASEAPEPSVAGEQGTIPISLGSPRKQPTLDIQLPQAPLVALSTTAEPRTPAPNGGVPEHSDWAEQVESDLASALARLENLALDDHQRDLREHAAASVNGDDAAALPIIRTTSEHYLLRLSFLLRSSERRFPVTVGGISDREVGIQYVSSWMFDRLKDRVMVLEKLLRVCGLLAKTLPDDCQKEEILKMLAGLDKELDDITKITVALASQETRNT